MNTKKKVLIIIVLLLGFSIINNSNNKKELELLTDWEIISEHDINILDVIDEEEYKQLTKLHKKEKRISYDNYSDDNILSISTLPGEEKGTRKVHDLLIYPINSEEESFRDMNLDKAIEMLLSKVPENIKNNEGVTIESYQVLPSNDKYDTRYVLNYHIPKADSDGEVRNIKVFSAYISKMPNKKIRSIRFTTGRPNDIFSKGVIKRETIPWNPFT